MAPSARKDRKMNKTLIVDKMEVKIGDERNLLELIRKAGIELPTFCYHSEISIYGACRMCMVEVEGKGFVASCSTKPEPGMVVRTNTAKILKMRKMIVELMLASHKVECPTCSKGTDCQLQTLARRFGIKDVRFKKDNEPKPVDTSSPALVRDPSKCVLCGDCVRMCSEVQGIGAIDFAHRGSNATVLPSFGKDLSQVECVYCGQCARVCPTGALVSKSQNQEVWDVLHDETKTVVVQIAPAVRIALGEVFGLAPGTTTTGQIVSALRRMGFDKVYDTSFTADLTIVEEANEFLGRYGKNENLPQFTSCCPGWVKYVEQYYPEFIDNMSSCKSPQQMLGSLIKNEAKDKNTVVVSIMPCTAKKYEASRPEFEDEYGKHVDYVVTTQELGTMIEEMGIRFDMLHPDSFDLPFGFKTGGGVIFGNSGGVSEAVLRYATEKLGGPIDEGYTFKQVRGDDGIREATFTIGDVTLNMAVVSGLGNAKKLMEKIKSGEANYDFIEVMACPGGCINGGGQPVSHDPDVRKKRTCGLYDNDKMLQLHKPQENPYIDKLYDDLLEKPGSHTAHGLLHTEYSPKKRIQDTDVKIMGKEGGLSIKICFGTSCFIRGSQKLMKQLAEYVKANDLRDKVEIKATFCHENCQKGPVITIDDVMIEKATIDKVLELLEEKLNR